MSGIMRAEDLPRPPEKSLASPVQYREQSVCFTHKGYVKCFGVRKFSRDHDHEIRAFGYVHIPRGVSVDMDLVERLNAESHWGITYPTCPCFYGSNAAAKDIEEIRKVGVVGFDCQHLHDCEYNRTEDYLVRHLTEMAEILYVEIWEQQRGALGRVA